MLPQITERQALDAMTTFGLHSTADYFSRATTADELRALLDWADEKQLPVRFLGAGANTIARSHVSGLVIRIEIKGYRTERAPNGDILVNVGAGELFDDVVRRTVAEGYGGLENLAAIPGTVGGAVVQNIGAYGVELAERLVSVTVWDRKERIERVLSLTECDFAYRHSVLKTPTGAQWVVLGATLCLPKTWTPVLGYRDLDAELQLENRSPETLTAGEVESAVRAVRARKLPDPAQLGNAGSFFTNPIVTKVFWHELLTAHPHLVYYKLGGGRMKLAAAWLIEAAGFKGRKQNAVGVYDKHALILVNYGGATGEDVIAFSD
ncbi:UDP-N-acetylmuramate dehydrogenase, partial [gut metagenome]